MRVFRLDPGAPALVLAPHLQYPTRDGADISLDQIALNLSRHLPYVDVVAADTITRFEGGNIVSRRSYANEMRSRSAGALRTLVRRSHYLLERFLTPQFRQKAAEHLADPAYGFVLFSYIETASIAAADLPEGRLHAVWTHNDQIKWFRNLHATFGNPLLKAVARISERWYGKFFSRFSDDFLFLYVTREDYEGHLAHLGPHPGLIVPIGVDVNPMLAPARYGSETSRRIRLLFVGSLSARMNLDALLFFSEEIYPKIRERLGEQIEVVVAGSKPGSEVVEVCQRMGWSLKPDIPDDELDELYAGTSYALLPFPYSTGAKLKLLGALAHGVPFLATANVRVQLDSVPAACVVSDSVDDWIEQILLVPFPDNEVRTTLHRAAQQHSWASVTDRFVDQLKEGVPSDLPPG